MVAIAEMFMKPSGTPLRHLLELSGFSKQMRRVRDLNQLFDAVQPRQRFAVRQGAVSHDTLPSSTGVKRQPVPVGGLACGSGLNRFEELPGRVALSDYPTSGICELSLFLF